MVWAVDDTSAPRYGQQDGRWYLNHESIIESHYRISTSYPHREDSANSQAHTTSFTSTKAHQINSTNSKKSSRRVALGSRVHRRFHQVMGTGQHNHPRHNLQSAPTPEIDVMPGAYTFGTTEWTGSSEKLVQFKGGSIKIPHRIPSHPRKGILNQLFSTDDERTAHPSRRGNGAPRRRGRRCAAVRARRDCAATAGPSSPCTTSSAHKGLSASTAAPRSAPATRAARWASSRPAGALHKRQLGRLAE